MKNRYISFHRHTILLFFMTIRLMLALIPVAILVWLFYMYRHVLTSDMSNYIILPLFIISVNYIFLQLILNFIDYYGKVTLVGPTHIIIVHTSFMLIDDIEFINIKTIIKLDIEQHGLLANLFHYGHVTIEQRTAVRKIHYVTEPYVVYDSIKKHIPDQGTVIDEKL